MLHLHFSELVRECTSTNHLLSLALPTSLRDPFVDTAKVRIRVDIHCIGPPPPMFNKIPDAFWPRKSKEGGTTVDDSPKIDKPAEWLML